MRCFAGRSPSHCKGCGSLIKVYLNPLSSPFNQRRPFYAQDILWQGLWQLWSPLLEEPPPLDLSPTSLLQPAPALLSPEQSFALRLLLPAQHYYL